MNWQLSETSEGLGFPSHDTSKTDVPPLKSAPHPDRGAEGTVQTVSLSQPEYLRFRKFLHDKIGLDYPEDKRQMLEQGLAQVMRATHTNSLHELYNLLTNSSPTSAPWDELVSALTIGETYFFRHTPHFDALAKEIIPAIMAQREFTTRQIRIWSAGCATGEEPYSIAMQLLELIPTISSWNIFILATDINRDALSRARTGIYSPWSFRGVDKPMVEKYFRPVGNQFEIINSIKSMVTFGHLNLVNDPYPSMTNHTNAMDIVLCRNVTIYFSAATTQRVVQRFYDSLVNGGWFIPGPSEPNLVFYGNYVTQSYPGTVIYQRSDKAKPMPAIVPLTESGSPSIRSAPSSKVATFDKTNLSGQDSAKSTSKASVTASKIPAPTNGKDAGDLYAQALALMEAGQSAEAMPKLYAKLDQDGRFVPAYIALGKVHANLGHLGQARLWCERALELDRLNPQPYYLLSMIHQEDGMFESAVQALKKSLYLDRDFVMAHYSLAQLYIARGEKDAARKSLLNIQRLLNARARDSLVPEGDGLNVERLQELVEGHLAHDV